MASAVLEKTPVSGSTPPVVSVRLTHTQRLMNNNYQLISLWTKWVKILTGDQTVPNGGKTQRPVKD